jgi:uncharacterized protein YdeI (YjbR/CyaY-like superfamily)
VLPVLPPLAYTDAVDIGTKLYAGSAQEWRRWLETNGAAEQSIWLVFFKKRTGKHGVSYGEAVEEALCFGWIDGQMKSIDGESYALRFSPRRKRGAWSETNRGLARRLIRDGRMTARGRDALPSDWEDEDYRLTQV